MASTMPRMAIAMATSTRLNPAVRRVFIILLARNEAADVDKGILVARRYPLDPDHEREDLVFGIERSADIRGVAVPVEVLGHPHRRQDVGIHRRARGILDQVGGGIDGEE